MGDRGIPRRAAAVAAAGTIIAAALVILLSTPAAADLPPGYNSLPGSISLNPSHEDTIGSEFPQDCSGLPRPPVGGEVAWHFVLPQSVLRGDPTPDNVFDVLTVTFASAGTVEFAEVSDYGPPTQAHAYVYTPTNDNLTSGTATIGRHNGARAGNDSQFNLGSTCASTPPTTTTTSSTSTTTTPTTTSSTTTTTTSSTTTTTTPTTTTTTVTPTTSSTTTTTTPTTTTTTVTPTTSSTTTTTTPTTTSSTTTPTSSSTTTEIDPGTTSTSISGAGPAGPTTAISGGSGSLPPTGGGSAAPEFAALAVLGGIGLMLLTRRGVPRGHDPR